MKNYNEFIKESFSEYNNSIEGAKLLEPYYRELQTLEDYINKDAEKSGIFQKFFLTRINSDNPTGIVMKNNEVILLPLHMELSLSHVEGDIVEYFNNVKEFFGKYHYVKMIEASSTAYYDILVDFKKLINSNLFRSLQGKHKFKI